MTAHAAMNKNPTASPLGCRQSKYKRGETPGPGIATRRSIGAASHHSGAAVSNVYRFERHESAPSPVRDRLRDLERRSREAIEASNAIHDSLGAKDAPSNVRPKLLAGDDVVRHLRPLAGKPLNGRAMLGRDVPARLPHTGRAVRHANCGGQCSDAAGNRDSPVKGCGGRIGYHDRDCAPNTNVMQARSEITSVTKPTTIADRLVYAREKVAKLSQEDLAKKAKVSQGTIGNIEAGLRKAPREILAIAKAAGVRPEWLKDGKAPMLADEGLDPIDADVVLSVARLIATVPPRTRKAALALLSDLADAPDDADAIATEVNQLLLTALAPSDPIKAR